MGATTDGADDAGRWFDRIRAVATPTELYALLFALPKGADLHIHLSGCGRPDDWYTLATTLRPGAHEVRVTDCPDGHARGTVVTVPAATVAALPACCRAGHRPLAELSDAERERWDGMLTVGEDEPDSFFDRVTPQLKHLRKEPELLLGVLAATLDRAAAEHVDHLEFQTGPFGYVGADGPVPPDEMAARYRAVLSGDRATASGVTARLLINVSRTAEDVEDRLRLSFEMADRHRDLWTGLHLSGREDQARRSLDELAGTYWELHRRYPELGVAVHAGEGFGAAYQVRPATLLPVSRIGHGLALVEDEETMTALAAAGVAVECSLISNVRLGRIDGYGAHPLRRFIEAGLRPCLSTDNPGAWGSQLTDEFYVATRHLDLSWKQVTALARNSVDASFAPPAVRERLRRRLDDGLSRFAAEVLNPGWRTALARHTPVMSPFARRHLL
ncbi:MULTISPECIES: hypothetical protein [Micromonospora]|uniref:hypothetical protein n=1 Tax=Micromonospora TaxID=1873 RepID=UPI001145C155|nr:MULTISPECIES: hypothetical protein [Micromonospora]